MSKHVFSGANPRAPLRTGIAVAALVAAIAIQIAIFHVTRLAVAAGVFGGAVAVSYSVGLTYRKIGATVRGFLILLVPVLVLQVIVAGTSQAVFASWATYTLRLTAAALVARAYFTSVGVSGVQNGLKPFLWPVPRRVAEPFRLIFTGSLFLLPIVLLQLRSTIHVGLLRYRSGVPPYRRARRFRRGRFEPFTIYPAILRAALVSILRIPEQRAGAMVIRGVLAEPAVRATSPSQAEERL